MIAGVTEVVEGELVVYVETDRSSTGCPECGAVAVAHGRRRVLVRDLPVSGRPVTLLWSKRIWRCPDVDCAKRTWSETYDGIAPRAVLTERARAEICRRVGAEEDSVAAVAREFGVSWAAAMAAVRDHGAPLVDDPARPEGVEALGVDETTFLHARAVRTPQQVIDSPFATPGAEPRPNRPRPNHKRIWASLLSGKDNFIGDVKAEMDRRDPHRAHTWVIVTDGERALQRRVGTIFGDITLVLDLLHVLQKLWAAAYAFHPEGSPEAATFVQDRAERILEGKVSGVVQGLRQMVTKHQLKGAKAKTLLDVAGYYHANRDRMRYHEYLANGWPIASGSVEGACKNLVRDRFERSGMRWSPAMAEAMLKLRAVYLSGDYDTYWEWHIQQDQHRLYPKGQWRLAQK